MTDTCMESIDKGQSDDAMIRLASEDNQQTSKQESVTSH